MFANAVTSRHLSLTVMLTTASLIPTTSPRKTHGKAAHNDVTESVIKKSVVELTPGVRNGVVARVVPPRPP